MYTVFSHPQLNRTLESCAMTECQQNSQVPGHYECRFVGVNSGSLALEKVDGDVISYMCSGTAGPGRRRGLWRYTISPASFA